MSYAERVKRDGPVAYWRLDEDSGDFSDSSENGNSASAVGTPNRGVATFPEIGGKGIELTGGNYINADAIGIGDTTVLSVEFWAKIPDKSDRDTFYRFGPDSANTGTTLYADWSSEDFGFNTWNGDIYGITNAKSLLVDGEFHHIAAVFFEGDVKSNRLWIDGVEQQLSQKQNSPADRSFGDYFSFGANHQYISGGNDNQYAEGTFDEVSVYKYALTPQQIRRHYWAGQGYVGYALEVLASDPFAYWRFSETSSASVFEDETENNNGLSVPSSGVTFGVQGALAKSDDTAIGLDGSTNMSNDPNKTFTQFSCEAWLKSSDWANADGNFVTMREGNGPCNFRIISGGINLGLGGSGGGVLDYSYNWSNDTWHHVAFTYERLDSSTIEAKLYADGVLRDSNQFDATDLSTPYEIGGSSDNNDYWGGDIDEVCLYGRILSAQEVRRHYELGLANNSYRIEVLSSLPYAYYRLDDPIGSSTFTDISGNSRDLSASGVQFEKTGALADDDNKAIFVDGQGVEQNSSWSFPSFTAEIWIQRDTWGGTSRLEFLQMQEGSNELNFGIENGKLKVWLGGTAGEFLTYDFSFIDGTWHYFVFTSERIDSSTVEYKMYVDGSQVDSGQADAADTTGPIAFPGDNGNRIWNGKNDEFAIYDRTLSQDEIVRHYYVGKFGAVLGTILFIAGVVTDESDGSALDATVRAYRWSDGALLQSTTSDPSTGEYRIEEIEDSELLVVMQPPSGLRPLAHGPVKPAEEQA